jgi:hypothetical protein
MRRPAKRSREKGRGGGVKCWQTNTIYNTPMLEPGRKRHPLSNQVLCSVREGYLSLPVQAWEYCELSGFANSLTSSPPHLPATLGGGGGSACALSLIRNVQFYPRNPGFLLYIQRTFPALSTFAQSWNNHNADNSKKACFSDANTEKFLVLLVKLCVIHLKHAFPLHEKNLISINL